MKTAVVLIAIVLLAGLGWTIYDRLNDEDIGSTGEAIIQDPQRFVGDEVTVTGEVDSFFPGAFTIGDSTWGEEMLIVAGEDTTIPRTIRLRQAHPRVRVCGTVRIKDERVELVPGADPFEGQPYVKATRIEIVER